MDEKWDRILRDRVVMTSVILGIIFAMFVPLLLQSRRFTVSVGEKITVYTAAENPTLFWSAVALCAIASICCEVFAIRRVLRLKKDEAET